MLGASIGLITLALVSYTVGVWAARRHGELRWRFVVAFAVGLTADLTGTMAMMSIARSGSATRVDRNPVLAQIMTITGTLALILMALHLLWAIITMIRNRPTEKRTFHRLSLVVWAIWLIPYFTGMAAAMV